MADIKRLILGLALLALAGAAAGQGRRTEGPLEVTPVRAGVYLLEMEPAGNVALSIGEDGAFIIDDQFAPMVPQLSEAAMELSGRPIEYVLNTHWHGDHTGGNAGLADEGATIVAHDNVRVRMSSPQYHLFFKAGSDPSPDNALPVITYGTTMTLHFNDDTVEVFHVPAAHTDGDSVFYFRNADVMHTGDAFINRGYPLIDVASGGTLKGTIEGINAMLERVGPDTIIIPGHGPLADRARMIEIRDMLVAARAAVLPLIEKGMTLREIKDAKPLEEIDKTWGGGFVRARAFVQIIYQSETGDWEVPPPAN